MGIKVEDKGDVLTITIDKSRDARDKAQPSKSGKTRVLATTNGFTRYGDLGLSLNVTLPLE